MSSQIPIASVPLQPQHQPAELSGLDKVMWYGIVQLAGIGVGWILGFYLFGVVFSTATSLGLGPNATPAQVSAALGPLFQNLALVVSAIVAVDLVGLALLTLGLRELGKVDRGRFSIPSVFMIVLFIGIVVVAAGGISLLQGIPTLIAQAGTSTGGALPPAFASLISSLLASLALLGIGAILALVGVIGGQILGLWRVGARYDKTIIKLGAIFTIIPLLNIVAPILVLVGAHEAKGQLTRPAM